MSRVRRSLRFWAGWFFGAVALATMARAAKEAFPGTDEKWRRYESPHFELFSQVRDSDSRDLLENLELLRAALLEASHTRELAPRPVTIYYFDREKDFLAYVPIETRSAERTAGYYLNRPDRAVIVLSPAWDDEGARRLIFHEYVHHIQAVSGDKPAVWFGEGMAELFSTIQVERDSLEFGAAIPEHVQALREKRMLPLAQLFAIDHKSPIYNEGARAGQLYAQAWALLHYCYCGEFGTDPERKKGRDRFFDSIRSEGEDGDAAKREALFNATMGLSYREMEAALDRYMKRGHYRMFKLPRPNLPPAKSYAVRPMPRDEIRGQLAALDLRVNQSPTGKLALLDALSRNPADHRALEVLGMEAAVTGDEATARERWQKAVEAGSANPAIFHELAAMEDRAWFGRLDLTFRMPVETAARLRQLLHRSIESAPSQAQAYEILAWVEATAEKPSFKDVNLVQQHISDLPDKRRTLLALAVVRMRAGDLATAKSIMKLLEADAPRELKGKCEMVREAIARAEEAISEPAPESAEEAAK